MSGPLPKDVVELEARDGWAVLASRSERAVYVRALDYHCGVLRFTRADLRRLSRSLGKKRPRASRR